MMAITFSTAVVKSLIVLVGICGLTPSASGGTPAGRWHTAQPVPMSNLVFYKDQFYGVGPYLYSSMDGKRWTQRLTGANSQGILVATENELVLPVGSTFRTSADGVVWATRGRTPALQSFQSLAYGKGKFVGKASRMSGLYVPGDTLVWSDDLEEWNTITTKWWVLSIDYVNESFVAWLASALPPAERSLGLSNDGINWTFTPMPASMPSIFKTVYGNGTYVGVGNHWPAPDVYQSAIITFTPPNDVIVRRSVAGESYQDVIFDGSKFVVSGNGIVYSEDGVNWTEARTPVPVSLGSIAFGNGLYLAGERNSRFTSRNGIDWERESENIGNVTSVCASSNRFVAFTKADYGGVALVSDDGDYWQFIDLPSASPVPAALYAEGAFLGFGDAGLVLSSVDGFSWSKVSTDLAALPEKVLFASGTYYALTREEQTARVYRARNIAQWEPLATLPSSKPLSLAVSGNTIVVSTGIYPEPNVLHVSTNSGVVWKEIPVQHPVQDIAFGGNRFVGVGDYGYVITSVDGLAWEEQFFMNTFFRTIESVGGSFVAAGRSGQGVIARSSKDGQTWISRGVTSYGEVTDAASTSDNWVIVGPDGLVFRASAVGPFFQSDKSRVENGRFTLSIDNPPDDNFVLESTTDFISWTPLTNAHTRTFSAEQPAGESRLFYRIQF